VVAFNVVAFLVYLDMEYIMDFPADPDLRVQWRQSDLEAYAVALNPAAESQSERMRRLYAIHDKTAAFVGNYYRICCFLETRHHHLPSLLAILSENVHRQYKVGILHPITMHGQTAGELVAVLTSLRVDNELLLDGVLTAFDKCERPTAADVAFLFGYNPAFDGCHSDYDWLYLITSKNLLVRSGLTESEIRARHAVSRLGERVLEAWKSPPKFRR